MRTLFFAIILLFSLAVPLGAEESLSQLESTNRLLRAELDLARTKQLYFFCDLNGRRLQFKTAGLAVAELPITGMRVWGRLSTAPLHRVTAKIAPFSPEREKVGQVADAKKEEKKEESKPFEIKALEITDMPTSFRIVFDDGLSISVQPAAENNLGKWAEKSRLFFWYLAQPLISNWNFLHGKPYTELHLTLAAKDVQLLHWSLAEGAALLLDMPATD